MKKVLSFLKELQVNNNKEWFDANRARYKEANEIFNSFLDKLIAGIGEFDPSVRGLQLKECTYRIYRDVRFSNDKTPYKTHFGGYICPKGKKSGYSGYYFHIEPKGDGLIGGSMLSVGLYLPEPKVLKSVREEIDANGDKVLEAINKAHDFTLNTEDKLKRVPTGFSVDSPYIEYLKLKNMYLNKFVDEGFILSDNLLERTLGLYKQTLEFNNILNRAVEYAHEEM